MHAITTRRNPKTLKKRQKTHKVDLVVILLLAAANRIRAALHIMAQHLKNGWKSSIFCLSKWLTCVRTTFCAFVLWVGGVFCFWLIMFVLTLISSYVSIRVRE